MPAVAFYISGHGYGHASRQIEVINAFARRRPDVRIFVRSAVTRWLLDATIVPPFEIDDRPSDTGVVQIDSLHLDAEASIAQAGAFYRTLDARAEAEAGLLQRHGAVLVVADAPPLGCAAAARAGIPSFVVSNFTWDWIYQGYAEYLAAAPDLVPTIQAAYRQAHGAWRLPMHGGFETFPVVEDIPLIARHAARGRDDVRRALGIARDRPAVLASFGAYGVSRMPDGAPDCVPAWTVVVSDRTLQAGTAPDGVLGIHEDALYAQGLRYEDLVGAVDAVLTKPGYGIVSECVANGTAMVYTSRGRFAEYDVFVEEMPRYLRCAFISHGDLEAGRWRAALERALAQPAPPPAATSGAGVAVARIIEMLGEMLENRGDRPL